jgi:hypothetical protein
MKFHPDMPVYGDITFRGDCPSESAEAVTFFAKLRREHPATYGLIATHIRNEGLRTFYQATKQKSEGMTTGAPDIIIPASPAFVCELKRQDHTKSKWQDGQQEYLLEAQKQGAFVCVALGYVGAYEAFNCWIKKKSLHYDK